MKVVLGSFILYLLASGKFSTYVGFATIPNTTDNPAPQSPEDMTWYNRIGIYPNATDKFVWGLITGK